MGLTAPKGTKKKVLEEGVTKAKWCDLGFTEAEWGLAGKFSKNSGTGFQQRSMII